MQRKSSQQKQKGAKKNCELIFVSKALGKNKCIGYAFVYISFIKISGLFSLTLPLSPPIKQNRTCISQYFWHFRDPGISNQERGPCLCSQALDEESKGKATSGTWNGSW